MAWTKKCASKKCDNYIPDKHDLCDMCIEMKYDLEATYDATDYLGMSKLYTEDSVLKALRKAEKENKNLPC